MCVYLDVEGGISVLEMEAVVAVRDEYSVASVLRHDEDLFASHGVDILEVSS